MRATRFGIAGLALLAALALAVPAQADGKQQVQTYFTGSVPLGNGSEATIYTESTEGRPGHISLYTRERVPRSWAISEIFSRAEAAVTNRTIDGPIGDVGAAKLRFKPTGPPREILDFECFHVERRPGVLVGSLRFELPGTDIAVDTSRIKAKRTTERSGRCLLPRDHEKPEKPDPEFRAVLSACGDAGRGLLVARATDGKNYVLALSGVIRSQGLLSFSYASRKMRPGAFTYSGDLSAATLRFPTPFSGTGEFAGGRLGGDLTWTTLLGQSISLDFAQAAMSRDIDDNCLEFAARSALSRPSRAQNSNLRWFSKRSMPSLTRRSQSSG
jgi:hypothetical protein